MSKLLIHDKPILILPKLAKEIGLNEAIVLQQIHYWLVSSQHEKMGRKWVYNTYKEWQLQMPFWSESTIKRTIKSLEEQGYVLSANFNRFKMDKTKWYSIDYEKLDQLEDDARTFVNPSSDQNETSLDSECDIDESCMTQAIPESTTESSSKNTTEKKIPPFSDIITYLNQKTNSTYRPGSRKTKELITARWNEGYLFEDFKKVIDLKTEEWLHDPFWNKYLRPETLFGTKFESYLNQKSSKEKYCEGDFDLDD
jgi:uncharacterized phage protein (TIGR02220 family)